jgi:hypothetical protein
MPKFNFFSFPCKTKSSEKFLQIPLVLNGLILNPPSLFKVFPQLSRRLKSQKSITLNVSNEKALAFDAAFFNNLKHASNEHTEREQCREYGKKMLI